MKEIAVLGSTGSIGTQTLQVVTEHPDKFKVTVLTAGSNVKLLLEQIAQYKPELVCVQNKADALHVQRLSSGPLKVVYGSEGLIEAATYPRSSIVVTALVGSVGVHPTLAAIQSGKMIALANKETLVSAGHIVVDMAKKHKVKLLPVDSEHSAIFQCLNGENKSEVEEIWLTASGGSFRHMSRDALKNVTVEDALKHPNWSMGAKITIDSATMMNKGFEVIEAFWLFGLGYNKIKVILHEESIIHSMVHFQDGAFMAQLGTPDMKVPIQYALSYPQRLTLQTTRLNLAQIGKLHFREIDFERYPCLHMAYQAGQQGGTMPTVLNAANEVAVSRFLQGEISFLKIEEVIEGVLYIHNNRVNPQLEEIEEADRWARLKAKTL
jgi:1-deoxy-D-xylulose-5-phosphate reductoisomerase